MRTRSVLVGGLGLALATPAAALIGPAAASDGDNTGTAIVIDPNETTNPISPDVFGFNHRYYDNGIRSFDPETGEVVPALADKVEAAGAGALRFPGGNVANSFRWKNAIGPVEDRGCQYYGASGRTDPGVYGVDEHAQFAERVGASTNIMVNFDTGTPHEAADWVEYMNAEAGENRNGGTDWAQVRADNGHPDPYQVTWWEVGNELGSRTWTAAVPRDERSEAYAFGGSATYTGVRVGTECDQTPDASLSTGSPGQEFVVRRPPVMPDSQTVYVDGTEWEQVGDITTAGPDDEVYELDAEAGRITFGDGGQGAIPAEGQRITIDFVSGPHSGYVDYYQAMKTVDPDIEICWSDHGAIDWTVLEEEPIDCLANHPYTFRRPSTDWGVVDTYDWATWRADQRGNQIANLRQDLQTVHPDAEVALTEYGLFLGDDPGPTQEFLRSLSAGVNTASSLISWIDAGVPLAQLNPLISHDRDRFGGSVVREASPFGYAPTFVPQAPAHVVNLFSHMTGDEQVASTVLNNPVRENATVDRKYGALQVVASSDDDGRLMLIVVNRDPEHDIDATVLPEDFSYQRTAEVWEVNGDTLTAHNTPENPDAVQLTKDTIRVDRDELTRTFPAHSVTALRLSPVPIPSTSTELSLPEGELPASAGEQIPADVTIANPGNTGGTGSLDVVAPDGWDAAVTPSRYTLAPGDEATGELRVDVPDDARGGNHAVAVYARERGQIVDVAHVTIEVSEVPGNWEPMFFDTFDDDPVGEPPQGYTVTGNPDRVLVRATEDGNGNVLAVERTADDAQPSLLSRTFDEQSTDLRLSYQLRKVSGTDRGTGLVVGLDDAEGNLILQLNACNQGLLRYTLGQTGQQGTVPINCATDLWHTIDLVFHDATGDYELYLNGVQIADSVRRTGTGSPANLRIRTATGTVPAEYAVDDVAVMTPDS